MQMIERIIIILCDFLLFSLCNFQGTPSYLHTRWIHELVHLCFPKTIGLLILNSPRFIFYFGIKIVCILIDCIIH